MKQKKSMAGQPVPTCPHCNSQNFVPILYGLPTRESEQIAQQGKIMLGGCILRDLNWFCKECETAWGGPQPDWDAIYNKDSHGNRGN